MRILIVEDSAKMARLLKKGLDRQGYAVDVVGSGQDAVWMASENDYDAIVLDVILDVGAEPIDGFEVCRRLRRASRWPPVLMVTARDAVQDRVAGLDAGADDYLTKPFSLDELLARMRALLRRASGTGEVLRFADLTLDVDTREAHRDDRLIRLTPTEFFLLELLLRYPRRVLTREFIFDRVWGYGTKPTSNSLEVYVGYLRRKTEAAGEPRLVHTVHR